MHFGSGAVDDLSISQNYAHFPLLQTVNFSGQRINKKSYTYLEGFVYINSKRDSPRSHDKHVC